MEFILISTTFANKEEAENIVDLLLNNKAAACVQTVGNITSKYRWKGKKESNEEILCFIKTTKDKFVEVEKIIKENHSYETPEIVAIPIIDGNKEYLDWIEENTN